MINFKTLTWKVNFYIFFSLVIAELLKCLIVFELVLILPIPWLQWKQFRIFFVQLAEVFFSRFIASVIHSFIQNLFKIVHFCVFIGFYQYVVFFFFQILWNSRCNILVSFLSHLKKLRSILIF